MKIVNKNCLVQQMIEKITLEVDAKIRFGKSLDIDTFNTQYLTISAMLSYTG